MENLILINKKDLENIGDELSIAMLNVEGFEKGYLDNLELIKNNIAKAIEGIKIMNIRE